MNPPPPIEPRAVAAPVTRSIEYTPDTPPTVRAANPDPDATPVLLVVAFTPVGMSNPLAAVKFMVAPPRVTVSRPVVTPPFGLLWITRASSPAFSPYRVVIWTFG